LVYVLAGLLVLSLVMIGVAATGLRASMKAHADLDRVRRFDILTGLPNREQLELALGDLLSATDRALGAVILVQLSRFEIVNETHGHEVGDGLLIAVADQLQQSLGEEERLFRFIGPEFVIVSPGSVDTRSAERRAEELQGLLRRPFRVGTDLVRVATNAGVAMLDRRHNTAREVLSEATIALQQAHHAGPETAVVFDLSMRPALSPTGTARRLQAALENDEFWVLYLPVVTLGDRQIVGVEALLRWADPERGLVSPGEFLRLLEDSGLIGPVGNWVIEQACRQNKTWQEEFPDRSLLTTINVSPKQLARANFMSQLLETVKETGVDPTRICLEIAEGTVMRDVEASWGKLREAKDAGIKLALDDFGTGYSSLSYLRRFDLDVLKIDREFISGIAENREDAAITQQLVALAHSLDIAPVAEGVDSLEQAQTLHGMGCDFAQGYYFSPPQPVSAIEAMLVKGTVTPADEAPGINWSGS
jgi:diguanylate cyclase (GGDEF)-like protein